MKWLVLFGLMAPAVWSQNFVKHQWQERIIVITSDETNLKYAEQQFNLFANKQEQLIDRKIVLYTCFNKKCTFYNWKDKPETLSISKELLDYKTTLIGLDGGIKYTTHEVQAAQVFFNLIDAMPMRWQEIKNKNKGND